MGHEHTTVVKKKKKREGRLSTVQKVLIGIIIFLNVLIIAGVGFWLANQADYDNSPHYDLPDEEQLYDHEGNKIDKTQIERMEGSYNILVLGRDKKAYLTDVMMIVNIDNSKHSMTVMQIPRDTYVSGGYPTNKLNAVYSTIYHNQLGYNGGNESDAAKYARDEFTKLIENGLMVHIDYTVVVNLTGFKRIVDDVGGVDVDIPFPMDYEDPDQDLHIHIPAGRQHLNGEMAEGFVRYRYGYATADLGRQDAQKQFMFALFSKVKSTMSVTKIVELKNLVTNVYTNVETNMGTDDTLAFAKYILAVDSSNVRMMTIPGSLPNGVHYVINKQSAASMVNEYFNLFNYQITPQIFDHKKIFTNEYDYAINTAYNAPEGSFGGNVYQSGEDIYIPPAG